MKHIFVLFLALFIISSCGNEKSQKDNSATEDVQLVTPPPAQSPTPQNQQPPVAVDVPAGVDGIVHHYVCADGCAGGFGDLNAPCPGCGKTMAHNKAFHSEPATITNPGQNTIVNQVPPPAKDPMPAQNAAGVWHYTCATGCAGGAGAMGVCSGCGGQLAHNKAYH